MVYFANSGGMSPWYQLFDWGPLPNGSFADMPDAAVANFVGSFLRNPRHEPFFCAAGLYKPHLPWHVPREFFDLYDPESLSLPLVKANDLDDVPPLGQKWAMSPPDHSMVLANDQWRAAVHGYLAAVSYADHMIGQIVDSIDSELMKRTIIVILGEHGFHLGEKSHWRKFALWEEATRVPLIMLMPGSVASRRVHVPVSLVDVFPTILELCGTPSHEAVDGESLSASVDSPQFMRRTPPIMSWGKGNHSVRTGEWRYTRYRDGTEELYDHRVDHYEWTNLASRPAFRETCETLRHYLPHDQ
jgi:arylsulfatase A-like enzyme